MKQYLLIICLFCVVVRGYSSSPGELSLSILERYAQISQEAGACSFTSPEAWELVDPEEYKDNEVIQLMVRRSGDYEFPVSLNLAMEPVNLNLQQYLELIKGIHEANGMH